MEDTLRRHLPRLIEVLEARYGREIDEWIAYGHFTVASWDVKPEFGVKPEHLLAFLTDVISDAFRDRAMALVLPRSGAWAPSDAGQAAAAVYRRCGTALRRLITQYLIEAVRSTPTEVVERELIEVMCGRRAASTQNTREAAVEVATFTSANPFMGSGAALLDLRYSAGKGRPYTEFWGGEIDPVWREIAGLLPTEVASLLPADESQWV